jgi:phosphatidylcholine synthase
VPTARFDRKVLFAMLVHMYTASGLLWAILTALAIAGKDYRWACIWMMVALIVDSTDGVLARRAQVKKVLPGIDGRKLDDIIDYLNYSFLPLLMMGWAGWIPEPRVLWILIPLLASVFAFCNKRAKEESAGFFVGFPSYWNVVSIYVAIWLSRYSPGITLFFVLLFAVMTVMPLRFVYPSHARRWRMFFIGGALVWIALVFWMLALYPAVPESLVWISLFYPALYLGLSIYLDFSSR